MRRSAWMIVLKVPLLLLLVASAAFAQNPVVPAIPGAPPAPTAAQIQAQLRQSREQLAQLRDQIAQTPGVGVSSGEVASASAAAAPRPAPAVVLAASGAVTLAPPLVPNAPTSEEVQRLEQELRRAEAQRRAENVTDEGMITASSAAAMRAEVVFPYVENSIYEVYAAPDRMTSIELQPGETITTDNGKPKAADTVQWVSDTVSAGEGADRRIIVMIKPILTGIETNMLIPTNRHVYSILLRSESQAYMPLVAFSYGADEAKASIRRVALETAESGHEAVNSPPEQLNFGYRIKGPKVVWTPIRVFDDGAKTYLRMPSEMKSWEAPALFVLEDKAAPQLVNYRVKGDYYIVDRLFHRAQLRIGAKSFVNIYRDDRAR